MTSDMPSGQVSDLDWLPRPWGRAGLDTIKSLAHELVRQIDDREGHHPL
ncbi:GAF domain-containing protein [Streptomyces] [Streptomyces griseus]